MEEIPNNHLRSTKTLWTMGYPPLSAGAGFRPSTVWKLVTLEPCRHVQLRDGFSQRNGGRMTYGFSTLKLMTPKIQLKCQVHFLWAFTDSYGWVSTPILRFLKSLIKLLAWNHHDFGCLVQGNQHIHLVKLNYFTKLENHKHSNSHDLDWFSRNITAPPPTLSAKMPIQT